MTAPLDPTPPAADDIHDMRPLRKRAKFVTTTVAQVLLGAMFLGAVIAVRDSDLLEAIVFALGLVSGTGLGGQAFVDGRKAKARQ